MTLPRIALIAAALLAFPAASAKPTHPAARHVAADWTRTAVATPEGGIRVGNPAAKAKLVEFFSFTCPHCAAFAGEAYPKLVAGYVKPGTTSFELRPALRDPIDFVVANAARAAAPADYLGLVQAIMAKQGDWEPKAVDYIGAHKDELNGPNGNAAIHAMLTATGLEAILLQHGVAKPAIDKALADKGIQAALEKTTNEAWNVRKIGGTPGFLIDDKLQDKVYSWETLEPLIQSALKG